MKVQPYTDLARSLAAQLQSRALKSEQTQLSLELATGQTSEPIEHLQGDVTVLADITQKHAMASQYLQSNRDTEQLLDVAQTALSTIREASERFVESLMVNSQSSGTHAPEFAGMDANATFSTIIDTLNEAVAGRHLFSGQTTDRQPLISSQDFRALVDAALSGATDAADIQNRLDTFFASGGTFDTEVYTGSPIGLEPIKTSDTSSVQMDLRADNEAFRDILKATLLTMAAADTPGLSRSDQNALVAAAQSYSLTGKDALIGSAGELGFMQQKLEQDQTLVQAQISAADIVRTEILSVDPYETASQLEDVNTRLEFLYTVTARARRLSFLEYMR